MDISTSSETSARSARRFGRRGPFAALLAALMALLLVAGCTADTPEEEEDVPAVTVSGRFGSIPVVSFDAPLALEESSVETVIEGEGRDLAEGEPVLLSLTAYDGEDGKLVEGREVGAAQTMTLTPEDVGEDLFPVLVDASEGSRLLLRQPVSEEGDDRMLVVVVDVLHTRARGEPVTPREGLPTVSLGDDGAPSITLPGTPAPSSLVVQPLVRGEGAQVRPSQEVTVQYTAISWESGTEYDSTWSKGKVPQTVPIDTTFKGLRDGLVDQPVGSQVLLVIPPDLAQGTDTLVMVVDILAASGGDDEEGSEEETSEEETSAEEETPAE